MFSFWEKKIEISIAQLEMKNCYPFFSCSFPISPVWSKICLSNLVVEMECARSWSSSLVVLFSTCILRNEIMNCISTLWINFKLSSVLDRQGKYEAWESSDKTLLFATHVFALYENTTTTQTPHGYVALTVVETTEKSSVSTKCLALHLLGHDILHHLFIQMWILWWGGEGLVPLHAAHVCVPRLAVVSAQSLAWKGTLNYILNSMLSHEILNYNSTVPSKLNICVHLASHLITLGRTRG